MRKKRREQEANFLHELPNTLYSAVTVKMHCNPFHTMHTTETPLGSVRPFFIYSCRTSGRIIETSNWSITV